MARNRAPARPDATLEGGNKPGARTRVTHQSVQVENIKDARIRVGATRAPQLTPETPGQSTLASLFDSLGEFSDGPYARALRDQHYAGIEESAEQAVFEGTSLDDIEDPNFVFEHYYRGAQGRKLGIDTVSELKAAIAAQADDDLFDVDSAAQEILGRNLPADLDPNTATNAAALVREHFPQLLADEKTRRTNKVRLDTLLTAQGTTTEDADLHLAKRNWDGALAKYEAGFADAKNLEGVFDPKTYNAYITSDIVASLVNPENQFTEAEIADYQAAVSAHQGPNGSRLWTHPETGPRLKRAFAQAMKDSDLVNVKAEGETRAYAHKLLETEENIPSAVMDTLARFESDDAMAGWHQRLTKKHLDVAEEEIWANNMAAAPNAERTGDRNPYLLTADLDDEEYNRATDRLEKVYEDVGGDDPDTAFQKSIAIQARHARLSKRTRSRIRAGLAQRNPQELEAAYMATSTLAAQNPEMLGQLPADAYKAYQRISMVTRNGLGFSDFIEGRAQFTKGFDAAKSMMSAGGAGATMTAALEDSKLNSSFMPELRSLTEWGLASGTFNSVEDAAGAAAEQLEAGVTTISGLPLRVGEIDAKLGDRDFYRNYRIQAFDYLRDDRNWKTGDVHALLDDMALPTGQDQLADYKVWPRVNGSTWVYTPEGVLAYIIPTDPSLKATYKTFEPRTAVMNQRAADNQAEEAAEAARDKDHLGQTEAMF